MGNVNEGSLGIICLNVAGLAGKHASLFDLIRQYDIFCFIETFVEQRNIEGHSRLFLGYELKWEPAVRISTFGRAKGGIVIGVKSSLSKKVHFVNLEGRNLIKFIFKGKEYYILFVYLSGSSESEWGRDFEDLKNFIDKFMFNRNFILVGDCNCRIADEQTIPEQITLESKIRTIRVSKDLALNRKGRLFLDFCADNNLVIVNGRTNGDLGGEYTFLGPNGSSVIDYCCVSVNSLPVFKNFSVGTEILSDHMPLLIELSIVAEEEFNNLQPLLPKLIWCENKKDNFRETLIVITHNVRLAEEVNEAGNILINMIYNASGKSYSYNVNNVNEFNNKNKTQSKQIWFDNECNSTRNRVFKLLNLFRKTNSLTVKNNYLSACANYKKLCEQKKKEYYIKSVNDFNHVRDAKDFWACANKFRRKKFKCDVHIKPGDWVDHFSKLLNSGGRCDKLEYAPPNWSDDILDKKIDLSEIQMSLKKSKYNKAPGYDRIPFEHYKQAPVEYLKLMVDYFNLILESGDVPTRFVKSIIFPIHKKGEVSVVSNYRGISFMNTMAKLFTGILLARLERWVITNNILNEYQAGFRRGYSTCDNVFNLISIINLVLKDKGKKLYSFFVDFKAAFDNVNRHALFYKLYSMGLSSKFMNVLKGLYNNTNAQVWCNGSLSPEFETLNGVKQGCLLSPLIFALYLNDLHDELGGGVKLGDLIIRVLLYADDIVLLATDAKVLQLMINKLKRYCDQWGLSVNLDKSKIMIFRRGGRLGKGDKWKWEGNNIGIVNKYKYLGITLTPRLSFTTHAEERSTVARFALNNVWNHLYTHNRIPVSSKWAIFNSVCRAILGYGMPAWGYKYNGEFEGFQRYAIKKLLGVPANVPNYVVYLETGIPLLWQSFYQAHVNYIMKVFNMADHRLPKKLAKLTIEYKVGWFRSWLDLGIKYGCRLANKEEWGDQMAYIIGRMGEETRAKWLERAKCAEFNTLFQQLCLNLGDNSYINDNYDKSFISIIFRARCGCIGLNNGPHREEDRRLCSLCNLNQLESIEHFMGICPVLKYIRIKWFKCEIMGRQKVIDYLNGEDWRLLVGYVREAREYRRLLVEEFNY